MARNGRTRKQEIRGEIWSRMEREKIAAFPGARGRIPSFKGAARAADLLSATPEWRNARAIKCNPDAPQRPVRLRALREGKTVYMAVPRLRSLKCFWRLDPSRIEDLRAASSIRGAATFGEPIDPRELPQIDLFVVGAVAVDRDGARIGKGGGYSDLEWAIGRQVGALDERTPVATTIHPVQLLAGPLPSDRHDLHADLICTPDEVLRPPHRKQPSGLIADQISEEQLASIPILRALGLG